MQQNFINLALLSHSMFGGTHQRSSMKSKTGSSLVDPALPLREQRNARIRDDYFRMYDDGKRNSVILQLLSAKYFLAADTVEHIVWQRGRYRARESQQPAMAA